MKDAGLKWQLVAVAKHIKGNHFRVNPVVLTDKINDLNNGDQNLLAPGKETNDQVDAAVCIASLNQTTNDRLIKLAKCVLSISIGVYLPIRPIFLSIFLRANSDKNMSGIKLSTKMLNIIFLYLR